MIMLYMHHSCWDINYYLAERSGLVAQPNKGHKQSVDPFPMPATDQAISSIMRESNFAFPAPNKACVYITSQLYNRQGEKDRDRLLLIFFSLFFIMML